ncbi:MAG: hypothetical protein WCH34_05400 [Bacteroidota bacterium]
MKPSKPIILFIPAKLVQELNTFLESDKPNFNYDVVYFYYIVHYILEQQLKNRNKLESQKDQFISINIKNLKSITVCNIRDYIKIMENGEFIISDNHYIPGEKSKGYIINPIYLKGSDKIEVKTDTKLFSRIMKNQYRKKAHFNRLEPYLKQMKNEFMKVEFDYISAENWIQQEPNEEKRISYTIALNQLKDKRFRYFNRNSTNHRLDTNLTNLKKEIKQFIIGDYVNIDLKNSQPFFLGIMLNSIIKQISIQQGSLCCYLDYSNLIKTFGIKRIKSVSKIHQINKKTFLVNLKSFTDSVINGTFYDDFIKTYTNGITRDEVKDIMFEVLFSQNEISENFRKFIPYEKEKKVFASVYPYIYEAVKLLKSKDHTLLPVFLQKIESYVFIDCIAKELVSAGIVPLTVHDSVIVKAEDQDRTIEIINRIFLEIFDVMPTLDIKLLHK